MGMAAQSKAGFNGTCAFSVMNQKQLEAYINLINMLLSCPSGEINSILNANRELVDTGLVQTMEQVAAVMTEQGKQNVADFLINVAGQIIKALGLSTNVSNEADGQTETLPKIKQDQYLIFLDQIYNATEENNSAPQAVYPFLAANLDKLNDDFAQLLRRVITDTLSQVEPLQAQSIAAVIGNFGDLMREFPQGDRASNLEIAIACCEVAAIIFTRKAFPEDWAINRNNLATGYTKRIRGDREENLERAIAAYEEVLQVYTQTKFPQEWARTQSNLGNAYSQRIRGNRAKNLERAIQCYQSALQVRTCETCPEQWATTQLNLGSAYWERIEGDRGQNLELAIAAFQAALQVYSQKEFPQDWAMIQNNLGIIYWGRIEGDREPNLEQAITHFVAALQVYIKEGFPQYWATVQNNLGSVYLEQGNFELAIACFQLALEVYKPTTFPLECLGTGQNLGNTARVSLMWAEAIEGYRVAIEAVEQSRSWAIADIRRQAILANAIHVYDDMVEVCVDTQQFDLAIEYVERCKSRSFIELLHTRDLLPKGDIAEDIINELKRLRQESVTEQRRLEIAQQNQGTSMISAPGEQVDSSVAWLQNRTRLNELVKQLDNLITYKIDPIDPNFKTTQKVNFISFKDVQNLLVVS
jgi:tetratricopeptide (TPR) repeat protein